MRMGVVVGVGALCAATIYFGSHDARGRGAGMPDVLFSECTSVSDWGPVASIRAYALGTHTCNIGTDNLLWGTSHNGTPVVGFNAYRLDGGRLMQIGMSWAKHGTGAAAGPGCLAFKSTPPGGSVWLDGSRVSQVATSSGALRNGVKPGSHTVGMGIDDSPEHSASIQLGAGQRATVHCNLLGGGCRVTVADAACP